MRSKFILACGLATVVFWSFNANAQQETTCENAKLRAASRYTQCLFRAFEEANARSREPSQDIARCDEQFDRAFERAEADGSCHNPGGALPVRDAIKEQVLSTFVDVAATGPCAALYLDADYATCLLSTSASSIDLDAMLDQINTALSETRNNPPTVDGGTTIWIQAWGGHGGAGADIGNMGNEGVGGNHGYAQTTTTVDAIDAAFGATVLHYYLGRHGSHAAESGGDGGTATFVSAVDATMTADVLPTTLLAAAGGGGGGAGNAKFPVQGLAGGDGAVAISGVGAESKVSGDDGGDRPKHDYSGQGGGSGGNGGDAGSGSATAGQDQFAPVGGAGGGSNTNPLVGFLNQSGVLKTAGGGHGGAPGDGPSPGGGGGGGLAGGGGGGEGTSGTNFNSGGGGGGSSLALESTKSCSIAPTSRPTSPNGASGFVEIGIDLGGCK